MLNTIMITPFITCYFVFLAMLLGACMGSFLNCMAWRIVHNEPVSGGRSHCDVCNHTLGIADLIPIISYTVHRGRCRYCGAKLSKIHLIAEIISAMLFAAVLLKFDISLQALEYVIFACLLMVCSFADLEGRIIPDRFIAAGIAVRAAFFVILNDPIKVVADDLAGGFGIAGLLLIVVLAFEKLRGIEAMGGGDIKLIFMTGIFLGWKVNLLCLFIACIIGIITGLVFKTDDEDRTFPWGPSIALAAAVCMLFGNELIEFYLGLF